MYKQMRQRILSAIFIVRGLRQKCTDYRVLSSLVATALCALSTHAAADPPATQPDDANATSFFQEEELGTLPGNGLAWMERSGERDAHMVSIKPTGDGWIVHYDGEKHGPFRFETMAKESLTLSPNGERWAVIGGGRRARAIVDGKAHPWYQSLKNDSVVFSPDGEDVAYSGRNDAGVFVVLNGEKVGTYDHVSPLTFSSDSKHLTYAARINQQWHVIIDGEKGPGYDQILNAGAFFSPDGERKAYTVSIDGDIYVIVDDVKQGPYESVSSNLFAFSLDGRRFVYGVPVGDQVAVVMDGEKQDPFEAVPFFTFSLDGEHYCYVGVKDDEWSLVVDGEKVAQYDKIAFPSFMSNGEVAYVAVDDEQGVYYVIGEKKEGPYLDIAQQGVSVSDDGKHYGYTAFVGNDHRVVFDGVPGPRYDEIWTESLVLSPEGGRYAYVAKDRLDAVLVIDGEEIARDAIPTKIGPISFSRDGAHWASVVGKPGKMRMLVDGRASRPYQLVLSQSAFDEDGTLDFLAARDGKLYRVTVDAKGNK